MTTTDISNLVIETDDRLIAPAADAIPSETLKTRQVPGANLVGGLPIVGPILGGLLDGPRIPSIVPGLVK